MNRILKTWLKHARFLIARRGYDLHPIDQMCWSDQRTLLMGKRVDAIFDVGANRGTVSSHYRNLFPESMIYCFEPQPDFAQALRDRFQDDKSVSIHEFCLGMSDGPGRLFINRSKDTSSLLPPMTAMNISSWTELMEVEAERLVDVRSLDTFCDEQSIHHINILKLDTQGTELQVLKGAARMLSENRVDLIFSEIAFVPMYQRQAMFGDICHTLATFNYRFHYMYNHIFNGRSGKLFYADAIFLSSRLAPSSSALLRTYTCGPQRL